MVFRNIGLLCVSVFVLCGGCEWGGRAYWLSKYDGQIKKGSRAIETARDDAQRAQGYAARARGYAEKARYSRFFKLIPADEYGRLFDLAVKDHDQAVALDSNNAEAYFARGQTYYDRAAAVGQDNVDPNAKAQAWLDLAKADFSKAVALDGRHLEAFDMRGLINQQAGRYDEAIGDFEQVMRLNSQMGRSRLAGLYCMRGTIRQKEKRYDLAISDYEKSMTLVASPDVCDCDPYAPLAWLYYDPKHQYDKSWAVVRKAKSAKRWISPEFLDQLKRASGKEQ